MSITPVAPVRRVRHQAREAVAVMAFSVVVASLQKKEQLVATSLGRYDP